MQWSQIKTLFILCFLALNVYLLFQLYDQQQEQDFIDEPIESTFEEQLEQDNISVPESVLDASEIRESFMTVEQKKFDEEEFKASDSLLDQELRINNDSLVVSVLEEKVKIPEDSSQENIEEVMKKITPYSSDYSFWKWDESLNIIIFFQQKNEQAIYYNQNGLFLLFLNDKNEVTHYSQTMLADEEEMQESQKLISPLRAIETIYNSGQLIYGDEVTKAEVGFHTRIPSSSGVQVFVPTWKVIVNDDKHYFVNAIEGYVFSSDEHDFLLDTLNEDLKIVQSSLKDSDKIKNRIVNFYRDRIEMMN